METFSNKTTFLLELLLWQNSRDPKKKSRRPKPFVPEFMKPETPPSKINEGAEPLTVDDVKSWLAVPRGV